MNSVATAYRREGRWSPPPQRLECTASFQGLREIVHETTQSPRSPSPAAVHLRVRSENTPPLSVSPSQRTPETTFGDECVACLPSLRRYARRLAADQFAAEDLVHDTILLALANRHRFARGSNLRAWLFTIMHNQFINCVRRRAREANLADAAPRLEMTSADQEIRQLLKELASILDQLPEDKRQVLLLHHSDGLTYTDIARRLNVPDGTVRSRMARARYLLRSMVERDGPRTSDCAQQPPA
jgi:RNA polymerase sigma factor (sigma-70 family)